MSGWHIRLPVRDRADSLAEIAFDASVLEDPEERATVRQLVLQATLADGFQTAGDLVDHLEQATPAERRQLLDDAREAAGLERTEDIDQAERFRAAQQAAHRRAAQRPVPSCAICGVNPTCPNGMPDLNVRLVRKWHCPECVAQAEPGDMDPRPSAVDLNMRLLDPDEDAREQHEDALRAERERQRRRDREAERAAITAARERYEESVAEDDYVRPLIAGIRGVRMEPR